MIIKSVSSHRPFGFAINALAAICLSVCGAGQAGAKPASTSAIQLSPTQYLTPLTGTSAKFQTLITGSPVDQERTTQLQSEAAELSTETTATSLYINWGLLSEPLSAEKIAEMLTLYDSVIIEKSSADTVDEIIAGVGADFGGASFIVVSNVGGSRAVTPLMDSYSLEKARGILQAATGINSAVNTAEFTDSSVPNTARYTESPPDRSKVGTSGTIWSSRVLNSTVAAASVELIREYHGKPKRCPPNNATPTCVINFAITDGTSTTYTWTVGGGISTSFSGSVGLLTAKDELNATFSYAGASSTSKDVTVTIRPSVKAGWYGQAATAQKGKFVFGDIELKKTTATCNQGGCTNVVDAKTGTYKGWKTTTGLYETVVIHQYLYEFPEVTK